MRRLLWLLSIVAALSFIAWRQHHATVFETDMLQLLPSWSGDQLVQQARARVRNQAQSQSLFLIGAADFAQARSQAEQFANALMASQQFVQVEWTSSAPNVQALAHFYTPFADRLLSHDEAHSLQHDATQQRERLLQHWFSPVGIALENDPIGNVARFLQQQTPASATLSWHEDVLQVHRGDRYWILVRAQAPDKVFDAQWQTDTVAAIQLAYSQLSSAELLWTGLFKFAHDSRTRTTTEINWISSIGTAGLLLTLWLVLRRVQPVLLMLAVIATSMIGATALSLLVYSKLHLITYVFGATLIGIAGDYALHYLVLHAGSGTQWQAQNAMRQLAKPLTMALLTTLLAYAAICLTPFEGFRQMAVFCLFGLICAYLSVVLFLPECLPKPATQPARFLPQFVQLYQRLLWRPSRRQLTAMIAALVLICAYGFYQLHVDDDVHLLQKPSPQLLQEQQQIAQITQIQPATQFVLIRGQDAEQVLQREEAATALLRQLREQHQLDGFRAISDWLPSQQLQQRHQQLVHDSIQHGVIAKTVQELGGDTIALARSPSALLPAAFWSQAFNAPLTTQWFNVADQTASIVTLNGVRDRQALLTLNQLPGVQLIDERAAISQLFAQFRQQAMWLVAVAYLIVAVVLSWRRGVQAMLQRLLPTIAATALTIALLGCMGVALNLFHGVALMLVLGIGVDYALFLADGEGHEASSLLAIVLSALTAMLAFGLLSFSHLPAVSGFGVTVLLGVGLALLFAPSVFWWQQRE